MAESSPRRKLAVILATDVVGYGTKMEENEEQTLKNLKVCRNIIDGLVEEHHGRIFNTAVIGIEERNAFLLDGLEHQFAVGGSQ